MEIAAEVPEAPALNITDCLYHNFTSFPRKFELYTCTIIEINGQKTDFRDYSKHMPDKSNDDVKIVRLMRTKNCSRIPKGLKEIFPKMEILIINDCKISEIDRGDLKGLENLKDFIVEHTPIYHLNSEVFKDLRDLEVIMFHNTKLSTIEPNILDSLNSLKAIYFIQNPTINSIYVKTLDLSLPENFGVHTKTPSIEELKKIIKGCSPCDSVCTDLKKLLANEDFKDFTVTIKESCYHGIDCNEKCCNEVLKVHKFLLIARSPILAKMIHKNPDARNLNLIDIPRYAFKKVVDYFYNGVVPTSKSDPYLKMKDLYAVADKLGLNELRQIARNEILRQEIHEKNGTTADFKLYQNDEKIGENSKKLKMNEIFENQITKSLDYNCSCGRDDRIDMMGLSLNYMKQDLGEKCVHVPSKRLQNQVLFNQHKLSVKNREKMTQNQKIDVECDGLDITDDYYNPEDFQEKTQCDPESSTSHNLKHKIPRPPPENLNYRNANGRGSMITQQMHKSVELNDSAGSDFVKIELEDQYEIIGDFYDEVCSIE